MSFLYDSIKNSDNNSAFGTALTILERNNLHLGNAYLQLTPMCNLDCNMCYAKMTKNEVLKYGRPIMDFNNWKWYIDRIKEMGTAALSLTGGECMLHPDFKKIYTYAYDQGFLITIMTNGTIMNDGLFELFKNRPPACFSVTIYGSSYDTYEKTCHDGNAYYKAYRNVERLIDAAFFVSAKYTVVRENASDLLTVFRYFYDKGIRLKYQKSLFQYNKADADTIQKEEVDDNVMREIQSQIDRIIGVSSLKCLNDESYIRNYKQKKTRDSKSRPSIGIRCAAGKSICHIRWDGIMTPCVSFDAFTIDPRETGFIEAWRQMNQWAISFPCIEECDDCIHQIRCQECIAFHYNDMGASNRVSPRLCWKRKYPKEAENIEKCLLDKGIILKEDVDG